MLGETTAICRLHFFFYMMLHGFEEKMENFEVSF